MDYCECGHAKTLHAKQSGCFGRRGEDVGNPRPCECMKFRLNKYLTARMAEENAR